jgi:C-terminal processing protease CtpA/Prc
MQFARSPIAASLALILAAIAPCSAATPIPPALAEAIEVIRASALDADRLDWDALGAEIVSRLGEDATAEAYRLGALKAYADPHASYLSAEQMHAWQTAPPAEPDGEPSAEPDAEPSVAVEDEPPVQPEVQPAVPAAPWGELLPGGVGYLGLPPCTTGEPEQLQAYARTLRELIVSLDARGATAWVVDLRLNGGGNIWPMLAGLAPLLGDGPAATSIGRAPGGGPAVATTGLEGDGAWLDDGTGRRTQFTLAWEGPGVGPAQAQSRIGVLLGPWTMSSGELVAVALASRAGTRSFGEPTAGLTTATGFFPLSDGSALVLPVSRMATVGGPAIVGPIRPDEAAPFGDWPRVDDEPVRVALEWLGAPAAGDAGVGD